MKLKNAIFLLLFLFAQLHAGVPEPTLANSADVAEAEANAAADATAKANAAQAAAIQRENHTGTQAHTTITGLGTASKINSGMLAPRIGVSLKEGAGFTKDARHITLLGLGDSLSQRTPNAMESALQDQVHINGYALGNAEPIVVSGTVTTPGSAMNGNFDPTIIDHGRVWAMASGSVVKIGRYYVGAATQTKSNVMNLWCSKQSGGGTLTVEHSEDNGSTWISPGWTLDTNGTAKTIAKQEFRIGAWASYQGTGTVYTTYSPSADTVTITGATGAYTGYNVTCARNGSLNSRPAYTVTGAIRVYFSDARQEWCIGDPVATNPDFYINAFAEYPPTCATQRDTTGTRQRLWRLTASGGAVNLVGAKIWDFQSAGVVMAHAGNGGLALDNANLGAASIRNGIGMDLGPTVTLATIVTNSADNAAIVNATSIALFVDNWLTAIPVNDLVMIGNHAYTAGRDALNATIQTVLSSRPRATFYDPIDAARNAGYIAAQAWDAPDATHYDDAFWRAVGVDVFRRTFADANNRISASRVGLDGVNVIRFGSFPVKAALANRWSFPVSEDNRGEIRLVAPGSSSGQDSYFRMFWNATPASSNVNAAGLDLLDNGFGSTTFQFDRNGAISLGPVSTVSASSKSTTVWAKARSAAVSALRAETSASAVTEVAQEWGNSTSTYARMRGDGRFQCVIPTYADDAAADADTGLPSGYLYRTTAGGRTVFQKP